MLGYLKILAATQHDFKHQKYFVTNGYFYYQQTFSGKACFSGRSLAEIEMLEQAFGRLTKCNTTLIITGYS